MVGNVMDHEGGGRRGTGEREGGGEGKEGGGPAVLGLEVREAAGDAGGAGHEEHDDGPQPLAPRPEDLVRDLTGDVEVSPSTTPTHRCKMIGEGNRAGCRCHHRMVCQPSS